MGRRKKEPRSVHRENIASVASQLFAERGISSTSMDDIAKAAGYSKATQHHFHVGGCYRDLFFWQRIKRTTSKRQWACPQTNFSNTVLTRSINLSQIRREHSEFKKSPLPLTGSPDRSCDWIYRLCMRRHPIYTAGDMGARL